MRENAILIISLPKLEGGEGGVLSVARGTEYDVPSLSARCV